MELGEITCTENAEVCDVASEDDCNWGDPDAVQWLLDKMWTEKYGDITRDELSRIIVKQKTIKNDPLFFESNLSWLKINFG
jgi:hypothetical protein